MHIKVQHHMQLMATCVLAVNPFTESRDEREFTKSGYHSYSSSRDSHTVLVVKQGTDLTKAGKVVPHHKDQQWIIKPMSSGSKCKFFLIYSVPSVSLPRNKLKQEQTTLPGGTGTPCRGTVWAEGVDKEAQGGNPRTRMESISPVNGLDSSCYERQVNLFLLR